MKINQYNYFKPEDMIQVEVVDLTVLTAKPTRLKNLSVPHRTDFYHVFLFGDCHPKHWVDFEPVVVVPNSVLCLEAGRVHQFDHNAGYTGKVLIFTERFFDIATDDTKFLRHSNVFNNWKGISCVALDGMVERLRQLFRLIEDELVLSPDQQTHALLQNMVHQILLLILRQINSTDKVNQQPNADLYHFLEFRNLLESEYATQKSVNYYAEKLNISHKKLNFATQEALGKTAKMVIHDRVLLEAKRMLVHGKESVKEISFILGFDEPTNFIKYFRLHTHQTPLDFKKQSIPQ